MKSVGADFLSVNYVEIHNKHSVATLSNTEFLHVLVLLLKTIINLKLAVKITFWEKKSNLMRIANIKKLVLKSNILSSIVGLAFLLLVVLGCPKPNSSDRPYSFSLKSREISNLLDEEKYEAARLLLKSYIPQEPNDAGLYCQYVRFLAAGYKIEDNPYLSTPLFPPNGEASATELIKESAKIAVQLESENKEWITDTILKNLYLQVKNRAESGEGYISYSNPGLIYAAWTAIEIDAETSKNWADKYKALIPYFAKSGKISSAMFTGNLAGDLAGGKNNSGQDFTEATKAFKLAVESTNRDQKTVQDAWYLYVRLFEKKCKQALENRESDYFELLQTIKAKGYKLNEFINTEYLPANLRPTPTPSPTPYSSAVNSNVVPVFTPSATPTPRPTMTPTPDSRIYLYITAENLNLRSESNLDNEPILEIKNGDRLYLLSPTDCRTCAKDGKWFRVHHLNTGKEGWISSEFKDEKTFEFEY